MTRDQLIDEIMNDLSELRRRMAVLGRKEQLVDKLTTAQKGLMAFIYEESETSIKSAAMALQTTGSAVTQLADSLVEAGCVERRTSLDDRRVTLLSLSPDGLAQVKSFRDFVRAHVYPLLGELDEAELAEFHRLHAKLISGLDRALAGPEPPEEEDRATPQTLNQGKSNDR